MSLHLKYQEYTIYVCLCLQSPVPLHSLDVTMEDVSQTAATVVVLSHAQMAVMKMDVVSTLCTH